MELQEVNQICLKTLDPSLAARRLMTLSQSYGASTSTSILVVDLLANRTLPASTRNINNVEHQKLLNSTKVCHSYETLQTQNVLMSGSENRNDEPNLGVNDSLVKFGKNNIEITSNYLEEPPNSLKKITMNKKHISTKSLKNYPSVFEKTLRCRSTSKERELNKINTSYSKNVTNANENVGNISNKFQEKLSSNSLFHDRSSPSGQSFSDMSFNLAEDGHEVYEPRKPVWPGQMGPVPPSGPFALDLNRTEDEFIEDTLNEYVRSFNPQLIKGRDRLSYRSSTGSAESNCSKFTRTGIDSIRSSLRSSDGVTNRSVPVFRPFYHFPSPNSIILLNKSNAGELNSQTPPIKRYRSAAARTSGRTNRLTCRLRSLQKKMLYKPSVSKSLTTLSEQGAFSDSDASDFSCVSKCGGYPKSEPDQVIYYMIL